MFRTKKDVDKHSQEIFNKITNEKDRNLRCLNIAQQYYNVRDYESAKKYVSLYLSVKDDSSVAHRLLGQCYDYFGEKDIAFLEFKRSLALDPKQPELIKKICELLASNSIVSDQNELKSWYEKGEILFPYDPSIIKLKQMSFAANDIQNYNPEESLLRECKSRPNEPGVHEQLLHTYINQNKIKDAFNVAFSSDLKFIPTFKWYQYCIQTCKLYKVQFSSSLNEEFYANYLVTVERMLTLAIQDVKITRRSIPECVSFLANFDELLSESSTIINKSESFQKILKHMYGQLCFHTSNILFRKLKWEDCHGDEMIKLVSPLLLLSSAGSFSIEKNVKQDNSLTSILNLCYTINKYRISQSVLILMSMAKNDEKNFIETIFHICARNNWREKISEKVYSTSDKKTFYKTSFFINHAEFSKLPPELPNTLPDVENFISLTESIRPASLHHLVWLGIQYLNDTNLNFICVSSLPHNFRVQNLESLQFSHSSSTTGFAESLSKIDVDAFLYACVYCAKSAVDYQITSTKYQKADILPADVSKMYCSPEQEQWWEYVHQMVNHISCGNNISRIRTVVQRGLENIRLLGNNNLPLPLLVLLGRTFTNRAKFESNSENAFALENRAFLYWKAALISLEKIVKNETYVFTPKSMFGYMGKIISKTEAIRLINEAKQVVGMENILVNGEIDISTAREFSNEILFKAPEKVSTSSLQYADEHLLQSVTEHNIKIMDKLELLFNKQELLSSNQLQLFELISILSRKIDDLMLPSSDYSGKLQSSYSSTSHLQNNSVSTNANVRYNTKSTTSAIPCQANLENVWNTVPSQLTNIPTYPNPNVGIPTNNLSYPLQQYQPPVYPFGNMLGFSNNILGFTQPPVSTYWHSINTSDGKKNFTPTSTTSLTSSVEDNTNIEISDSFLSTLLPNTVNVTSTAPLSSITSSFSTLQTCATKYSAPSVSLSIDTSPSIETNKLNGLSKSTKYIDDQSKGTPAMNKANMFGGLTLPTMKIKDKTEATQTSTETVTFNKANVSTVANNLINVKNAKSIQTSSVDKLAASAKALDFNWKESSTFGGFTFCSKPVIVTPSVTEENKKSEKKKEDTQKSVFAEFTGFSVSSNALDFSSLSKIASDNSAFVKSKDFKGFAGAGSKVFSSQPVNNKDSSSPSRIASILKSFETKKPAEITSVDTKEESAKLNKSISEEDAGNADEFVPTAEFTPVVPLPELVEVVTGEEGLEVLYQDHCKLFRFVNDEWKERGIGKMKILKSEDGSIRLLMRRDQVHKICCNQRLTKEHELKPMKSTEKAWTWRAQDFSEGELSHETLCVRFKTLEQASKFKTAFDNAKSSLISVESTNVDGKKENVTINKSATEDDANNTDEFVPTAEFTPVVPLPDVVEIVTGEEGLEVLYQEHCKLFRFVNNEWKERGIGKIKILKNNEDGSIRLLMRRDQVHKICCNQRLTKEHELQPMKTTEKAWTWQAQDFSEGELKNETLCVRFKTVEQSKEFKTAFENAKLSHSAKTLTTKLDDNNGSKSSKSNNLPSLSEMFKREKDSWDCKACYVTNKGNVNECVACGSSKDGSTAKQNSSNQVSSSTPATGTKFNFGIPAANDSVYETTNSPFKSSSLDTKSIKFNFSAGGGQNSNISSTASTSTPSKASFCIGSASQIGSGASNTTTSSSAPFIFGNDSKTPMKFSFENINKTCDTNAVEKGDENTATESSSNVFTFGTNFQICKPTNSSNMVFGNLSPLATNKQKENVPIFSNDATPSKSASIFGANASPDKSINIFNSGESNDKDIKTTTASETFVNFSFKLADAKLNSSPDQVSSVCSNQNIKESEFLVEKVPLLIADKNDNILFKSRAKLFRWHGNEWNEHGDGEFSFIQNNKNNKYRKVKNKNTNYDSCDFCRFLMIREPVEVACLNHYFNKDIKLIRSDQYSWVWSASDFSEGEIHCRTFRLEFEESSISDLFKVVTDNAAAALNRNNSNSQSSSDEVEFISETNISEEDKKKAESLLLPSNYYAYKYSDKDCPGCIGCDEEDIKNKATSSTDTAVHKDIDKLNISSSANNSVTSETKSNFIFGGKFLLNH